MRGASKRLSVRVKASMRTAAILDSAGKQELPLPRGSRLPRSTDSAAIPIDDQPFPAMLWRRVMALL